MNLHREALELEARFAAVGLEYEGREVPRPPHWSGYRLAPERIEYWEAAAHRLSDRICYQRDGERWAVGLLQP